MVEENKPCIRLNAKMTSKGEMQLDVTVETYDLEESSKKRASRLAIQMMDLEKELETAGYQIAGKAEVKL